MIVSVDIYVSVEQLDCEVDEDECQTWYIMKRTDS